MDHLPCSWFRCTPTWCSHLIPNKPCKRVFVKLRLLPKLEEEPVFPPDVESGFVFAVDRVRDNLGTFAKLRGGHMHGSSYVRKSHSAAVFRFGLLAMVPTLVALCRHLTLRSRCSIEAA